MPFRLAKEGFPSRAKIQFTTAIWMPYRIYEACKATGTVSNTVYIQHAVCEALARDLQLDLDSLLADLPTPRGPGGHLFDPADHTMNRFPDVTRDPSGGRVMIGPANTIEDVR
jgi:hypothetical protein